MKSKILTKIYFLAFALSFLPFFVLFIIPKSNANFAYFAFVASFLYIIILVLRTKDFLSFVKTILKQTCFKYYLYFVLVILLTTIFHMILGFYTAPSYFYITRLINHFISIVLVYLFPVTSCFFNIRLNKIIKFILIAFFVIIYTGIVQYIAFIFNIDFIMNFIDLFSNWRSVREVDSCFENLRVYSIFDEPCCFAQFICIIFPIIFDTALSKYRLLKNSFLNSFVKKTIILSTFMAIVFTKSPIFLIIFCLEFVILLLFRFYKQLLKYKIFIGCGILLFLLLLCLFCINIDNLQETYLSRIFITLQYLTNLKALAVVESSLATRLISYGTQIIAFKQNILFGVGLTNVEPYTNSFFLNTSLPMTLELLYKYYKIDYATSLAVSSVWTTLAETGLIGFVAYFTFIYKNFVSLHKIINRLNSINYVFYNALLKSLIVIIILSFYNLNLIFFIIWIIYGLILLISVIYSKK